jgi:hypothetical protein
MPNIFKGLFKKNEQPKIKKYKRYNIDTPQQQ